MSYISLSLGNIDHLRSAQNFPLAEGIFQRFFFDNIHRAVKKFFQIQFHLDKVKEAGFRIGGKRDHHIYIAIGAEIIAQYRAKERKF